MVPTSLHLNALPVAAPALNAPKLPLNSPLEAPTPVGWYLAKVSVTPSGLVSLPKLGVAAPILLRAVTVALKLLPALIGAAVMALKAKSFGAAMKVSVPVMVMPLTGAVFCPFTVILPTSAYISVVV